jgi:hypothetical protein
VTHWRRLLLATAAFLIYCFVTQYFYNAICPSLVLLGLPCPCCGLTRAGIRLMRGDISGSLRMNPMIAAFPIYVFVSTLCFYKPKLKSLRDWFIIISIVAALIVYILRVKLFWGTEPLQFNEKGILFPILAKLLNKIYVL